MMCLEQGLLWDRIGSQTDVGVIVNYGPTLPRKALAELGDQASVQLAASIWIATARGPDNVEGP